MPVLDWIFAGVLLLSMLLGGWRGFVYEAISLVAWVSAFAVARWLGPDVAQLLPISGVSGSLRQGAGFGLVFVGSVMLGALLAVLSKKLLNHVGLRPVDRVLGALFGAARGVLLLLLASTLVQLTALKDSAAWRESTVAGLSSQGVRYLKSALPADLQSYLPT